MINSSTHFIYRIVCFQTGKCYIGQTINPYRRKAAHFEALRRNRHINTRMQNDFNEYGETAFYFELIQQGISESDIDSIEKEWIEKFDSQICGYNIAKGGKSGGNQRYFDKRKWNLDEVLYVIKSIDNDLFD